MQIQNKYVNYGMKSCYRLNVLEIYFPPLNLSICLQLSYVTKCYHDSYVLKLEKADVYRLPYLASSGPGFGLLPASYSTTLQKQI